MWNERPKNSEESVDDLSTVDENVLNGTFPNDVVGVHQQKEDC
jgi:hypothetical protein